MRLLVIFLFIGNILIGQQYNYCDSINNAKKKKNISLREVKTDQHDINISIDNSQNPNCGTIPYPIQVTTKEICCDDKSTWIEIGINCLGAFVGFGLSLFIYWHQIEKEKKKERVKKKENDKDLLKYYSELIRKNLVVATKNLNLLDEYIVDQSKDLTDLKTLARVPSHDFQRLINVDNKGVFEAWINTFKNEGNIRDYQRTNSAIDIIDGVVNEVHRMHKYVIEHSFTNLLEVKNIIDHLPDRLSLMCYDLAKELGSQRHQNSYFLTLDNFIKLYSKLVEEKAPISKFVDEFATGLLISLNKDYRDYPNSAELIMLCKKSRTKLNDVKIDIERMLEDFKKIKQKVSESFQILEDTNKQIDKI